MTIRRFLSHLATAVATLVAAAFVLTLLVPNKVGGGPSDRQMESSALRLLSNQSRLLIATHGREPRHVELLLELLQMWRDRWDTTIRAEWNEREVVLTSAGPDGKFDTEDDIKSSR